MKVLNAPVRWLKSHWSDEDIWYFFEADEDGWVLRQVELHGREQTPACAAALAEWPDAMTEGLEAVQKYESKYGAPSEKPISTWDADFPHEEISRAEFDEVWSRARAHLELRGQHDDA